MANCLPPKDSSHREREEDQAAASRGVEGVGRQQRRRSGDPPLVGVARPADLLDINLTHWVKDSNNPAHFAGAPATYSGPSNVWKNSVTGKFQMEMILGQTTGLFETTDPSFHNWTLVDDRFYPIHGGGGGMFFPLPRSVDGLSTTSSASGYTHMLQEDFRHFGDGEPRFVLGTFDPATSKFTAGDTGNGAGVNIDFSADIVFSLVNIVDDGRMVHMGWIRKCVTFTCTSLLCVA